MKGNNEAIPEETIPIEAMDTVGGEAYLIPADLKQSTAYTVISAEAKRTQWGDRVDFIIQNDQGYRYILSSWNFVSKKFKPTSIIGKEIMLDPYTDKKVRLLY